MDLAVNGVRLYYDAFGDHGGPSVVVFHGGPGLGDHRAGAEPSRSLIDDGVPLVGYNLRSDR